MTPSDPPPPFAVPERFHDQLVETGKLVAAGELTAGLAHEINNPLFAILGLLEFLLDEVEPGSKAHERLVVIQETGIEIGEIIRVLAEFGREPTRSRRLVSLVDATREAVELARKTGSASLEIVERYPAEGPRVFGSPNQLKQVLLHLLSNARQAMPDGGTVTVEVAAEGSEAAVSVTDTGPGVPAASVDEAFELFTTTRDTGGTGLGLAVSRSIAAAHGGSLSLETPPRGGARFTLRLPRSAASR